MRIAKLALALGLLLVGGTALAGQLSPNLEAILAQKHDSAPLKVLVVMRDRVDITALDLNLHEQRADLAVRHVTVIQTLKDAARSSQDDLLTDLAARQLRGEVVRFKAHWLLNSILVTASEQVIRELAARPDVEVIEPNLVIELIEPTSITPVPEDDRTIGITPGVVNIGARRVWNELGIRGEGAIIGSLDTGVAGTHPALASRWRGLHHPWQECWLDLLGGGTQFPSDGNGHGTHTCGTMCGLAPDDTIGVAPAAEWIATNPINQSVSSGFDQDIIDAFEWFTDPDGNPNTMEDVPDVVQNSWGINEGFGGGYVDCDSRWWAVMDGCEAAGPVIVFAAGNEGSGASTLRSPADRATTLYNCFSVGATNHSPPYTIAGFSSRGPAGPNCGPVENRMKPEVSAPGVNIYSAMPGGGYQYMDGTSMACPHVAGVVALMRSANPNVDVITIKQVLMDTAHDLGSAGEDNTYGHGFIDAYEAVLAVAGGLGTVEGTVTDAVTGLPISGATITISGLPQSDITAADGTYGMTLQVGTWTLQVSAFGYQYLTQDIVIQENLATVANLAMTPLPSVTLSGIVYLPGGAPAPGAVVSVNAPLPSVIANAQGHYSLTMPTAGNYTVTASAAAGGYVEVRVPATADLELDLYLRTVNGDGFESGDMSGQPWILTGGANWFVQTAVTHSGLYAARSGAIGNTALSQMQVFVNGQTAGILRFWLRTSCQTGDNLRFYVDSAKVGEWSGETGWTEASFNVTAGQHSFRWQYVKNASGTSGQDCAWVDDIILPGGGVMEPNLVIAPASVSITINTPTQVVVPAYLFDQGLANLTWSTSELIPWLTVGPMGGIVLPGDYQTLNLTIDGGQLGEGTYDEVLTITSNDPDSPTTGLPIHVQVGGLTAVDSRAPQAFGLVGVVPNPFNPMTNLQFNLAASGHATLSVYDVQGRLVRTLIDEARPAGAGEVRWDGCDQSGRGVASGTYFARLAAAGQTSVKTLTLVR